MELFEREAAVLESLDHPGIPEYIEDCTSGSGRGDGNDLPRRRPRRRPERPLPVLYDPDDPAENVLMVPGSDTPSAMLAGYDGR